MKYASAVKNPLNMRFTVLLLITSILGILRVFNTSAEISIWASFTPIGAMALFGGAYFSDKYKAYAMPLLVLFISDVIIMQTVYTDHLSGLLYEGWLWNYSGFAIMVYIGRQLHGKVSTGSVTIACFMTALAHYLISNFGVWFNGGLDLITGKPYTSDWAGLISCYLAAIPYFKNLLLGNFIFSTILFGGFELAKTKFLSLRPSLQAKQ